MIRSDRRGNGHALAVGGRRKRAIQRLVAILKHNHYSVDPVYNGLDALAYLQAENYDGAVLDIMMPKMDGFQLKRELPETLPVIFCNGEIGLSDRLAGLGLGADDYIVKPFEIWRFWPGWKPF